MSEAEIGGMKTRNIIAVAIGVSSLAALNATAGPRVGVSIEVPAPPPPPVYSPGTTVETAVPDYYVWDGSEYVGVINGQYYYLGPGNMWVPMDQPRWYRFHEWERHNGDWRHHEIYNDRFRHENHEWEEHEEHEHHGDEHHGDFDHHDRDHHDHDRD